MDKSLGDLIDHIETKGVAENTLIIFLGDNGGMLDKDLDGISSQYPCGVVGASGREGWGTFIAAKRESGNAFQKDNPIVPNSMRQEFGTFDLLPTLCKVARIKFPNLTIWTDRTGDLFGEKKF